MKILITLICMLIFGQTIKAQTGPSLSDKNKDSLDQVAAKQKLELKEKMAKVSLQGFVIKASENTFGYSIYMDGQLFIEQKTIPGQAGNKAFLNSNQAQKCLDKVISKIKEGEMPPSLTNAELIEIQKD